MDVTIMAATNLLLKQLITDHPTITFTQGAEFLWSPSDTTVYYDEITPHTHSILLHELAHGLLGHHDYSKDVELLAMETEAWEHARTLADKYEITLVEDTIQDHLHTYREWLHARSLCPHCEATGFQSGVRHYSCIACSQDWRVNEARICALRRYSTT